jgi:hypothetical protein
MLRVQLEEKLHTFTGIARSYKTGQKQLSEITTKKKKLLTKICRPSAAGAHAGDYKNGLKSLAGAT